MKFSQNSDGMHARVQNFDEFYMKSEQKRGEVVEFWGLNLDEVSLLFSITFPFFNLNMRFLLFLASFYIAVFAAPAVDVGESSGLEEEKPHERMKLFNWDYKDLGTNAFDDISHSSREPIGLVDSKNCPDGWLRFSDSCYFIETELLGFAKAEKRCSEKKATLFVANSIDEWDAIRQHSPKAFFSWIGLVRFTQYEKSEELPRWQTEGALNPSKINWLIRPYKAVPNGWNSFANCAVHYNPPLALETTSYVFYYPCTSLMHSICERNATLLNYSHSFY